MSIDFCAIRLNTRQLVHSGRGHKTTGSNSSGERAIPVVVYSGELGACRPNGSFVVSLYCGVRLLQLTAFTQNVQNYPVR